MLRRLGFRAGVGLSLTGCAAWTSAEAPRAFDPDAPSRFDLSSYSGRAMHFLDTLGDLRTLVISAAEVERHKAALERFRREGRTSTTDDAALWNARKIVSATTHPDTGEMIQAPLRFSAFAPANLIICAGMLRPNPTLLQSAFWQWVNQSYNAAVNYANRSSSSSSSSTDQSSAAEATDFSSAYVAATASAVAICLGLQEGARRLAGGSTRSAQAAMHSR